MDTSGDSGQWSQDGQCCADCCLLLHTTINSVIQCCTAQICIPSRFNWKIPARQAESELQSEFQDCIIIRVAATGSIILACWLNLLNCYNFTSDDFLREKCTLEKYLNSDEETECHVNHLKRVHAWHDLIIEKRKLGEFLTTVTSFIIIS